jgi:hypothetical protein
MFQAEVLLLNLRCDAPFNFLFFIQQLRRILPETLNLPKWKGRTHQFYSSKFLKSPVLF